MGNVVEVAIYTDRAAGVISATERAPTREEMRELLESVAATTHSVRGRLIALAQVVRVLRHCPWIEGTLRVELARSGDDTRVNMLDEHGGSPRPALPSVILEASLDELRAAMRSTPNLFAPLRASAGTSEDAIVLATAT